MNKTSPPIDGINMEYFLNLFKSLSSRETIPPHAIKMKKRRSDLKMKRFVYKDCKWKMYVSWEIGSSCKHKKY
jgi:hypothetical protein